jgi:hypothetical protein
MKFKEIAFKDNSSNRIYQDYMLRVKHAIKLLNKENQHEILLEINSHIYESLNHHPENNKGEVEKLLDSLEKLGLPETFLKPLVAEKKLDEATKTFNPVKVAKAVVLNIGNGVSYIFFAIFYLLLFGFLFLIVAKITDPENVGLFYRPGKIFILGYYKDNGINHSAYEQLGNWFIPLMAILTLVFYLLITLLLRVKKSFK